MAALYVLVVVVFLLNLLSPVISIIFIFVVGFLFWDSDIKKLRYLNVSLVLSGVFAVSNQYIFVWFLPMPPDHWYHYTIFSLFIFYLGILPKEMYRVCQKTKPLHL